MITLIELYKDLDAMFVDTEATTEPSQTGARKKTTTGTERSASQENGSTADNEIDGRNPPGRWFVQIFRCRSKNILK